MDKLSWIPDPNESFIIELCDTGAVISAEVLSEMVDRINGITEGYGYSVDTWGSYKSFIDAKKSLLLVVNHARTKRVIELIRGENPPSHEKIAAYLSGMDDDGLFGKQ